MESYIVRIYRQDTANPHNMTGTIVKAGDGTETRFSSGDELISLLWQLEANDLTPPIPYRHLN